MAEKDKNTGNPQNEKTSTIATGSLMKVGVVVLVLVCLAVFTIRKGKNGEIADPEASTQSQKIEVVTSELPKGIKLEMIKIDAIGASISIGSNENKKETKFESDYYIGKYEVTQEQWASVMENNPSNFRDARKPVERVSRDEALEYCSALNSNGTAPEGWKFTLPSEAQWEFAASGGKSARGCRYSGSNSLKKVAWYAENSRKQTHTVGEKDANELGIYDMSGNVWEWCIDTIQKNPQEKTDVEKPVKSFADCAIRGGCWDNSGSDNPARDCPISGRYFVSADSRSNSLGFRLALVPMLEE